MLVGGVVVEDAVDQLAGRHRRLDRVEEADEFLLNSAFQGKAGKDVYAGGSSRDTYDFNDVADFSSECLADLRPE